MAAGAEIEIDKISVGEQVYLKAPITTPQGGGYKSLNVSTRKFLGLYANVRPCTSLYPFVRTKHPIMGVVIIRDLYAGIEHQQIDQSPGLRENCSLRF